MNLTIKKLRSIGKGKNIDSFKNMYRKPLEVPFTKLLRSQIPLSIPRSKVPIPIPLPGPQNQIPLRRPILLPRNKKPIS